MITDTVLHDSKLAELNLVHHQLCFYPSVNQHFHMTSVDRSLVLARVMLFLTHTSERSKIYRAVELQQLLL